MPFSIVIPKPVVDPPRLLGEIFISHASQDKRFVRRLTKQLEEKDYSTWVDEHKLTPGHPLATKLSEAIGKAQVVIVVISKHSKQSNWLKYELNLATERMVKNHCRVIPIVLGEGEVPPEIKGIVYADFRTTFKQGWDNLLRALEEEVAKLAPRPKMFSQEIERLLRVVYDTL